VTLARSSPDGSRQVSVQLAVRGEVYRSLQGGPSGTPVPAATSEGSGSEYTWGDGDRGGSDPGDVTCSGEGPLIPLRRSETLQHTYARPGTYTLTFTQTACGVPQYATRTLALTVR
jgi:hypothetical protein